jgi:hypothetical protein
MAEVLVKNVSYEQVKLEKMVIKVREEISSSILDDVDVDLEEIGDKIAVNITARVLGRSRGTDLVRYPSDWWQAFRERWLPGFWLNKFPVLYTSYTVSLTEIFPDISLSAGQQYIYVNAVKVS